MFRPELTEEFFNVIGHNIRGISAKALEKIKEFPNKLQFDILQVLGNNYSVEDAYDKVEEH